jgi:flotillin
MIAEALSKARLVTISGDSAEGGAAQSATSNITSVIQTVLAAQLVAGSGMLQQGDNTPEKADVRDNGRQAPAAVAPPAPPAPAAKTGFR